MSKKMSKQALVTVALLTGLAIVVILLWPDPESKINWVDLRAEVIRDTGDVYIKSSHQKELKNLQLVLNEDFRATCNSIDPMGAAYILWTDFTNEQNERFDIKRWKPKKIFISARIAVPGPKETRASIAGEWD